MLPRKLITLLILILTSSNVIVQAVSYPLQLVEKYNGMYVIRQKVPATDMLNTPSPVYNLKEVPAKVINISGNNVNIRPGNVCAFAQLSKGSSTSNVIVCKGGEIFNNVTQMAESTTISGDQEYRNYIGRGKLFNKKLIYCDGPCKQNLEKGMI
jgi:hypothetical protein